MLTTSHGQLKRVVMRSRFSNVHPRQQQWLVRGWNDISSYLLA